MRGDEHCPSSDKLTPRTSSEHNLVDRAGIEIRENSAFPDAHVSTRSDCSFRQRRGAEPARLHDGGVKRGCNDEGSKCTEQGEKAAISPTYLCSQLVTAALAEMGVLGERGGVGRELKRWLWLWPGAFGQGGAVEKGLGCGVSLGEEVRRLSRTSGE